MKKLLFIFSLILILSSCTKKQTASEDNSLQNQTTEKDFITMEEFLNEERNPNERCGITFYDSVTFCDIPDTFKIQNYPLFGVEGEYYLPKEPLKEIQFDYNYEEDYYYIQLPVETYEKNPELYLEAVQDEKSFFYNNKQTLKFNAENNYDGQLLDYNFYFTLTYRNLYSKNNKWTIYLKNVQTDEVITKKTVTINKTSDYVVYQDEYENPFVIKEDCNMQCEKKYNLMYKGKGSTNDNEGTIVVFSYKIDTEYVSYIPILAFKSKSDDNEVCNISFSIKQPGQYKIDFYDCATGKITVHDALTYLQLLNTNLKKIETNNTKWKVNTLDGLRLRDAPRGNKIGLLPNETKLLQTKEAYYTFYDCINGQEGFWIEVQLLSNTELASNIKKETLNCEESISDGWVFSGFLVKEE